MSKELKGSVMLFLAALIWGSSFIVMKNAVDFLTPAVLLTIRFTLASIFLCVLFFKYIKTFPHDKIKGALLTGGCLFVAYYVQTWGLRYTTPGKNAFLTGIYCAIVPFLVWLIYKKRPDVYNFIAAILCIIGIGLVSLNGDLSVNIGDILTLCGGFLYAVHILMVKHFSKDVNEGAFTAVQFIGGAILACFVSLIVEDIHIITQIQPSIFFQIFYLAFFATAITMVCQTIGQKHTSECNASLILSLESVFGVLFSVLFYGEVLSLPIVLGFIIIFIAIIISETKLSFIKNKKITKTLLVFVVLSSTLTIPNVKAKDQLTVEAPYAYVYDVSTDQVLYTKNANKKIYPASMTKVMTALVALDHMDNLDTVVSIQEYDLKGLWEAGASVANFKVKEKVTYLDLLYGIILPSGADACRATSRVLFGSEEKMVEAMNKKAKELGLKDTHFVNSTGLHHDQHYTTVHDMAIITKTALKNSTFKKIFTSRSYRTQTTQHYMAASILKVYWKRRIGISHIIGCKTGYTDKSKSCLTCLVKSQNQDIICVFAKESGSDKYVSDAKKVIDYYNQHYHPMTVINKGDILAKIKIKDGVQEIYEIKASQDIAVFVDKTIQEKDIQTKYQGETELVAPTQKDKHIGKMLLTYNDQNIKEIDVHMSKSIDATDYAKFCRYVQENMVMLISIAVVIIVIIMMIVFFLKKRSQRKKLAYDKYKQEKLEKIKDK